MTSFPTFYKTENVTFQLCTLHSYRKIELEGTHHDSHIPGPGPAQVTPGTIPCAQESKVQMILELC